MKTISKYRATASAILDTRSEKADHTFPVKLRVTYKREQKYYSIGLSLPKAAFKIKPKGDPAEIRAALLKAFKKAKADKPVGIYRDDFTYIRSAEAKADVIIESLPEFTFELFERHYFSSGSGRENVYAAYDQCIEQLRKEGRIGSAIAYGCSLQSLKKHSGKVSLKFSHIDQEFLQEYESKMIAQGNSLTTVGIYLRCLRSLFNDAISTGTVKQEFYPFGKRKYQIPKSKGTKKALLLSEVEKLYLHQDIHGNERRSLDLWLFSYLCNGMNIHDIARLKFKDISDGKITFIRTKTEHTTRKNLKSIRVSINSRMQEIIDQWKTEEEFPGNYVFGILSPGDSPTEEKKKVALTVKTINQHMKRIAQELGITKPVLTYTARHSWATVLKRKGYSTAVISEGLGHTSELTTQAYLDSFEDDTLIEISNSITNFSNNESSSQRKAGTEGQPAPRI